MATILSEADPVRRGHTGPMDDDLDDMTVAYRQSLDEQARDARVHDAEYDA